MKKVFKFIGNVLFVILIVVALVMYAIIGYEILDYFNIGADGS